MQISGPLFSQDWNSLRRAVNISFASSDTRYPKEKVPDVHQKDKWNAISWKGEKVHTQILIWTNKDISRLKVNVSDLVNEKGNRINAGNITAGLVRYVITDEFGKGCGFRKPADFDSSLVADPIDTLISGPISKNSTQPLWLSIKVPPNSTSGQYQGTITVNAGKKHKLKISLKVLDYVLPAPSDWAFDLDLWQHPAAIARVHNVKLWSPEHYAYMKPYYTKLAAAGQKNITASIIEEPWNHQTYDDFPGLIKWIKRKDGSWTYDYSLFDQYVSFVMSCGINKRINCYTMVPWKLSFPYYDEQLGKDTVLSANSLF